MEIAESQCLERLSVSSNLIIYSERNQDGLLKVLNLTSGNFVEIKNRKISDGSVYCIKRIYDGTVLIKHTGGISLLTVSPDLLEYELD
jgi:hypothetical protein